MSQAMASLYYRNKQINKKTVSWVAMGTPIDKEKYQTKHTTKHYSLFNCCIGV